MIIVIKGIKGKMRKIDRFHVKFALNRELLCHKIVFPVTYNEFLFFF